MFFHMSEPPPPPPVPIPVFPHFTKKCMKMKEIGPWVHYILGFYHHHLPPPPPQITFYDKTDFILHPNHQIMVLR